MTRFASVTKLALLLCNFPVPRGQALNRLRLFARIAPMAVLIAVTLYTA